MEKTKKSGLISFFKNRILKLLFGIFLTLIIMLSALFIFLSIPQVQFYVASRIAAKYDFILTSMKFNLEPDLKSLTIIFSDVKCVNPSEEAAIGFKSLKYSLAYSSILSARFYPEIMEIIEPKISITKTGQSNKAGDFKGAVAGLYGFLDSGLPETLYAFSIKNGTIYLDDITVENFGVSLLRKPEDIKKADFSIDMYIRDMDRGISVKADGRFAYNDDGLDSIALSSSFGSVPITMMPWPESFKGTTGVFSSKGVNVEWHKGGTVFANGVIHLPEAGFMLDAYNELKSYNLSETDIDFEAELLKTAVDIRKFEIRGNDFNLASSCYIPLDDGAKGMSLSVRSSMMPMERFKTLFPAPVTPRWIGKRLLPLFTGGRAKLSNLLIQGAFDKITGLDKKENASSLLLDIDIDSINIADFGAGLESQTVSANVLLDNGRLKISGVNGLIGKSRIREAVYDYVDTYAEKSLENWLISGSFSLPDLHTISESGMSPLIVRNIAKDIRDTEGFLDGDIKFSYYPDWKFISITGGNISSGGIKFLHPLAEYPINLKKLNIGFNNSGRAELGLSGVWRNTTGGIKGTLDIFKGDFELSGSALVDADDIADVLKKKTEGSANVISHGKQKTDFHISASDWKMKVAFDSNLEGFSGEFGGFVIPSIGNDSSLKLALSQSIRGVWKLDDFDFSLGKGRLSASVPVGLTNLHQFSFSLKNFDIGRLGLFHRESGLSFSGNLDGDILIKGLEYGEDSPGVFGELRASDTGIKMPGLPLENKGTGRVVFSGQRIYAESLKIGIGDTSLNLSADLKGWKGLKGKIGIKSKDLIIPSFADEKGSEGFVPVFDSDFAVNSDLKIDVEIDSGITPSKMRFEKASATCFFRNGSFDIKDGKIGMSGGEIRFRLLQPADNKNSVIARAYINLYRQKLRETFSYLGAEDNLSRLDNAILSTDAYIYCSGKNKKELVSSLGGYIHFNIEDGIIKKSSVIFSILSVLNLEKFMHERPEGVSKDGFYFSSLDAGFKIKDGVFLTSDLVIKSPIISMGATGEIDLNNKTIDMDMVASPLVTIDSFVSNIPFLGYILTGNDRALISYFFKVKGPLDSPETSYVPLQNIPQSIFGYFQRIFMTPGRIPEEIRDMKGLILDKE